MPGISPSFDLLAEVPDDVILCVFAYLDTARDLLNLARCCKRLARLLRERGWRIFTRARFPSLGAPREYLLNNPELSWGMLAESLTYQSRCWDRRSLNFTATLVFTPDTGNFHARQARRWPSRCDARYDLDSRSELLVWSEGEGFCARKRRIVDNGWNEDRTFARFSGEPCGLVPGKDDIVDLSIIDGRARGLHSDHVVLAARASGWLDLRSAGQEDLGMLLATFRSRKHKDDRPSDSAAARVLGQSSLLSMDVSGPGRIAASDKSSVFLYDLPRPDQVLPGVPAEMQPFLELKKPCILDGMDLASFDAVKWIGEDGDVLAVGVKGTFSSSLQYLQFSPSGQTYSVHRAAKTTARPAGSLQQIIASSMIPLDVSSISNHKRPLVLAAWQDGTCRLQDLRTPTIFDAVYEDNIYPESNIQHLLAWGTERFIAGGPSDELLRIFDFRWNKGYYHTQALPCRSVLPYPDPPQPFASEETRKAHTPASRRALCDPVAGLECTWHRLSRDIFYRPNCNIYFAPKERKAGRGSAWSRQHRVEGVRSLAKGSNLCPNFYVGVMGGFIEAHLGVQGSPGAAADPNLSYEYLGLPADEVAHGGTGQASYGAPVAAGDGAAARSTGYETVAFSSSLMETGDGLSVLHNDRSIPLPPLRPNPRMRDNGRKGPRVPQEMLDSHRLDPRYHHYTDFSQFLSWGGSYGEPVR